MRHPLPEPVLDDIVFVSFGPIIDPPFADAHAHPGRVTAVFDEVREVATEPWTPPLTDELAERAMAVAMDSAELRHELEGRRHEVIGVGLTGGKRERPRPVVIAYRYEDDLTVEATLDADATEVSRVETRYDQPILTEAEVDRARRIASQSPDLQDIDMGTGMGLLVSEENQDSPRYRHRLADLRFALPDRRMPQAFAIVDLSTEELIDTGVYNAHEELR